MNESLNLLRWMQLVMVGAQPDNIIREILTEYLQQFRTLPNERAQEGIDQIINFVLMQIKKREENPGGNEQASA